METSYFNEKSNEYVLSSPLGKNSSFYKSTTDDYDALSKDFYTGGINYELLTKDLKEKLGLINDFIFDADKYILKNKAIYSGSSSVSIPVISDVKNNKPFIYKKNDKTSSAIFDIAKLNIRKNILSGYYNFGIYFYQSKIAYNLNFTYKDGEDKKFSDDQTNSTSSPTDFKLNDEYQAIKLYTSDVITFIEFVRIVKGNNDAEYLKKAVVRYYKYFFTEAKNNPDSIDALYENIPDFVLETIEDSQLWNHLVILSGSVIDTIGTNENLSIINILKGLKNANWWYNQINRYPESVRKILEKFSSRNIEELIKSFSRIGLKNWTIEELNQAWKFDLDYKTVDFYNTDKVRYTGFAYYQEKEKKYKIGTALFAYQDEPSMMPLNEKEIAPAELQLPFSPMKVVLDNEKTTYIPCFVAEYFTNRKIDEEWWTVFNNVAAGLLPEFGAEIARGVAILSRILNGRKIKTVEELIEFLRKVDQNVMAEDLEKVGIQVLFRGTTRSVNGELFSGNINTIEYGASTSTDPIRAVVFGVESSSKPGTKGVLQIYVPKDLKGLNLQATNYRVSKELEVIVNTSPENLSNFAVKEISIEDARKLVNELYGIDIPKTITSNSIPNSNMLLEDTKKLTPKEAQEFYKQIIKFKK